MNLNKVFLIGRVGTDPEIRTTQNGTKVASLKLATTKTWKNDSGKQEKTEWHKLSVFGKLADVIESYVNKGSLLMVEGEIETRTWEKDGKTNYMTEIHVTGLQLGPKSSNTSEAKASPAKAKAEAKPEAYEDLNDEVPF